MTAMPDWDDETPPPEPEWGSPEWVEQRLIEAFQIDARRPDGLIGPSAKTTSWPLHAIDRIDWLNYKTENVQPRLIPNSHQCDDSKHVLQTWIPAIWPSRRRFIVVGAIGKRAYGSPHRMWPKLARRMQNFGYRGPYSRWSLRREYLSGLDVIARRVRKGSLT